MDPRVIAEFVRHDHLLTRREAVAAGIGVHTIDESVRRGSWTAVRRAVYTLTDHWEALDHDGRRLLESRAASLAMRRDHVRSHDSAALELGMQILRPDPYLVHVTRMGVRGSLTEHGVLGSRTEHGVKHHKAPYLPEQVVTRGRWSYLEPARTAADIAREHGLTHGVVAFDAAFRVGATRADVARAIKAMRCWPGVTVVRDAAALSDHRAQTIAESLGRMLVMELGFGRPEPQFGLTDGRRKVWCDLRLGRHIFEMDGWVKYTPVIEGGYAIDPQQALREEKERQDFICGFKLGVSRLVWDDFFGRRRTEALDRLRREYLDTVDRFGTAIDDLERYRIRSPPPFL